MKNTTHPASPPFGKPGVATLLLATLWFGGAFSSACTAASAAANDHWQQIAKRIDTQIGVALEHYRQGDAAAARSTVVRAYFSDFEDSRMEAAMRREIGAKPTWKVERMFGRMRKAIKQQAGQDEVAAIGSEIRAAVKRDARVLDQAGISPEVFEVNQ